MDIAEAGAFERGVDDRRTVVQLAALEEPVARIIRHHQVRAFTYHGRLQQGPGLFLLYKDIMTR